MLFPNSSSVAIDSLDQHDSRGMMTVGKGKIAIIKGGFTGFEHETQIVEKGIYLQRSRVNRRKSSCRSTVELSFGMAPMR